MTLADRRPLTNAYEPPLPAVRRWSICGAGLGFGPQSSQTGSKIAGGGTQTAEGRVVAAMNEFETQRFVEAEGAGHVIGGKRDSADAFDPRGRVLPKQTPARANGRAWA